jgi:CpeT/CpcT family (DUF1001)
MSQITLSPKLIAIGQYLSGEFENKQQALESPPWYVHLRLWLKPVPLFLEDSITLFAEQASIVNLDRPYRPRILRITSSQTEGIDLEVRHYMFKDIETVRGAGSNPDILKKITTEQIEFLPNCTLNVSVEELGNNRFHFRATPTSDRPCSFTYDGKTFQVALGFEVTPDELLTYDKGIDPNTGQPIWGALMGAYRYIKVGVRE